MRTSASSGGGLFTASSGMPAAGHLAHRDRTTVRHSSERANRDQTRRGTCAPCHSQPGADGETRAAGPIATRWLAVAWCARAPHDLRIGSGADQRPPLPVGEPVGSGPRCQAGGRRGGTGPNLILVNRGEHAAVHHQPAVDVDPIDLVAALDCRPATTRPRVPASRRGSTCRGRRGRRACPVQGADLDSCRPNARAPSMVAISSAFSAVMISGSRCTPLCIRAANFIAWSIEWFDDDAGPVRGQPHGDAAPLHRRNGREARAEVEVGAGVVRHLRVRLRRAGRGR